MDDEPQVIQVDQLPAEARHGPAVLCVEEFWREGGRCFVRGWAHAGARPVRALSVPTDAGPTEVTERHTRPDLLAAFPELPDGGGGAGFAVFLTGHEDRLLRVRITTDFGTWAPALRLPPSMPRDVLGDWQEQMAAFEALTAFNAEINIRGLEVLEVGARLVGSRTTDSRLRFPGASRFVGVDIHPGATVDVVGDAHALSLLVGRASFDAILSGAVLEHLEMPWIVAAEMNRVLRPGGLVFHSVPQAWPVHDLPNDFWRFTAPGLAVLFGPAHGFEVIACGMHDRVRIYPQATEAIDTMLPLGLAYSSSFIYARKVADVDSLNAGDGALSERARRYPRAR